MENNNININIDPCCCCKGNTGGNAPGGNATGDTPVGHILAYMGTEAPENYLVCDGTEYDMADYPELSEHLQKQFKSVNFFGGNGTDTFAVPDLRGEFLRGAGVATRGTGTGEAVGVHQEPTKVPHIGGNSNGIWWAPNTKIDQEDQVTEWDRLIFSKHGVVSGGQAVNKTDTWTDPDCSNQPIGYTIRPTNTAVLYCIKYK